LGHIAKTNFDLILREERRVQAKLAVKDEYTFDFAELPPEYSGHELEMQLVNNIRGFLIEMGGDFTFLYKDSLSKDTRFFTPSFSHTERKCRPTI